MNVHTCIIAGFESFQYPNAPKSDESNEGYTASEDQGYYDTPQDIDQDFLANHLRSPTTFVATQSMLADVAKIMDAVTDNVMRREAAASLLNSISKTLHESLSPSTREKHRKRSRVPFGKLGHLTFVVNYCEKEERDAPELVGVYNADDLRGQDDVDGMHHRFPYHRIEALVEVKPDRRRGGHRQTVSCAHRHHVARPDRPAIYCLVIEPGWYQVISSDPTGVVVSPRNEWTDLRLLAAYIYSHYYPPRDRHLWDDSVSWISGETPHHPPTWMVRCHGRSYTHGRLLFAGYPWGRRTTVFQVTDRQGGEIIIKDTYRRRVRRCKEQDILVHIHGDGDLPGVVRLTWAGPVRTGNKMLTYGARGDEEARTKERMVLLDSGCSLVRAKTVNDLLEAIYDVLEVHRTVLRERKILHRDMSINNILMYPKRADVGGRAMSSKAPIFIKDVLGGSQRQAIDYGTPLYIARSVSLGMVLIDLASNFGMPMPTLTGDALHLYTTAYGQERYDRYNEDPVARTCHGGYPPTRDSEGELELPDLPAFVHRPEHDVESVYWTMIYALLRAQPATAPRELDLSAASASVWKTLLSHYIPGEKYARSDEKRHEVMSRTKQEWLDLFHATMEDVALLLWRITLHVRAEYALWKREGNPQPDHLHEAVQRLILQYLIDHRDNPIQLDPDHLRPTHPRSTNQGDTPTATQLSWTQANSVTGNHTASRVGSRRAASGNQGSDEGSRHTATGKSAAKNATAVGGPSSKSKQPRDQAKTSQPRKLSDKKPFRSSKRLKALSGAPVSPTQQDEDSADDV
ncbi:hypothetical protein BD309DRAFT_1004721 [Dichomitus squalens]|nr:hypothetical protein BD309DRAFT_1004721 [Dichomitus squalens]